MSLADKPTVSYFRVINYRKVYKTELILDSIHKKRRSNKMKNLRNMITTGLAALVLASGCAASNTSLKSAEESEETPWVEGARDTGVGYEGIGCDTSSDRYLASRIAETRANGGIILYIAKERGLVKTEYEIAFAPKFLIDFKVQGEQRIQKDGGLRICSKVAVSYSGVLLR